MASEPVQLSGLARRLVEENILDAESASKSTQEARREGTPYVAYLVKHGLAEARNIAVSASEEFGVPLLDLSAFDVESIPKDLVKESLIRQHRALPLVRRGMRLFVAVSDPTNLQALDEIKFQTGVNTEAVLVEEDKLQVLIEQFLNRQDENALGDLGDDDLEDLDMEAFEEDDDDDVDIRSATDDTPVVRFVNKMLLDAIKGGSSDIHFEPYEKSYRVRFRTDGILHVVATPPSNLGTRLAARLKVMSELDISERRVPQDGRIKMKLSKTRAIDFRFNTLPTLWG
jgi:type IV pilus assembly protein PilB